MDKRCIDGKFAKEVFEPVNQVLSDQFYIRAMGNHIICNYIPLDSELDKLKPGHRVHIFISNLNFAQITCLLPDFIKNAYCITGRKVIIHVPESKVYTWYCVKSALWLYHDRLYYAYKLYLIQHSMIFKYGDASSKKFLRYVRMMIRKNGDIGATGTIKP